MKSQSSISGLILSCGRPIPPDKDSQARTRKVTHSDWARVSLNTRIVLRQSARSFDKLPGDAKNIRRPERSSGIPSL